MMMMMTALVCLQAKHVAGLPAAAEGRQILLRLLHQQLQQEEVEETAAAARCHAGVAAFHDQALLLHCAPVDAMITSTVSFHLHNHDSTRVATGIIDLAAQLRRPSPSVLSFVLGAGAVLSLTLHHRLLVPRSSCSCLIIPGLMLNCLRMVPTHPPVVTQEGNSQSSSSFITIEKGTISRHRPPSDNLLITDDDEGDNSGMPTTTMALEEELEVEDEFLAKLEADHHSYDLDALIKDLYL
ncbi:hypothetical protein QOZ80_6BG0505410 [Eleusine coracana subsp. coracana]|nr:hypothetical protein QOZ80_6BG0505410 [Eleusine coracana subsp. coracana]